MKALGKTILIMISILLMLIAVSCNDDQPIDGDTASDGDSAGLEGDGDDDMYEPNSGQQDDTFYAPMLSDPDTLDIIFGEDMQSRNINFGDTINDSLLEEQPFVPFTLDALKGARLTIDLSLQDGLTNPVLILYGPRSKNGIWGTEIALDYRNDGKTVATISDFPVSVEGTYLILVGTVNTLDKNGDFSISLGCRNQCTEPACPDLTCQGFCDGSYLNDSSGCITCYCETEGVTDNCEDQSDPDCNPFTPSCDCDDSYDPVCGEDGITYGNECEAECFGMDIVHTGECWGAPNAECSTDADCENNLKCIEGLCASEDHCGCEETVEPVCGVDGQTYSNLCQMECEQIELLHVGECEPIGKCIPYCGSIEDAFAWIDSCTGLLISIDECENCYAECTIDANGTEGWFSSCTDKLIKQEDCLSGCGCDNIWQPVCGQDGNTYKNGCEALCNEIEIAYNGECTNDKPGCESDADCLNGQVCVYGEDCEPNEYNAIDGCFGFCTTTPDLTACMSDEDCLEGEICTVDMTTNSGFCTDAVDSACVISGCNAEICSSYMQESDCGWMAEYACYQYAECALSETGSCEWLAISDDFDTCMDNISAGTTCTSDSDCLSDWFCDNGICVESLCICPDDENEVCGTNNQTYKNICELNCAEIPLLHEGPC